VRGKRKCIPTEAEASRTIVSNVAKADSTWQKQTQRGKSRLNVAKADSSEEELEMGLSKEGKQGEDCKASTYKSREAGCQDMDGKGSPVEGGEIPDMQA